MSLHLCNKLIQHTLIAPYDQHRKAPPSSEHGDGSQLTTIRACTFAREFRLTYLLRRFHTKAAWRSQRTEQSLRDFRGGSHKALSAVATAGLSET